MCRAGDQWQERLAAHFAALAKRRPAGHAVFALEHGLSPSEIAELRATVVARFGSHSERLSHWLPLAVHAAEVAYHFEGEYWTSFGEQTPAWNPTQAERHEVRAALQRFARQYRGPEPHGAWADWFTIICWPIANAVLPLDLQRQMARALFRAGAGLARYLDQPVALGRLVGESAWDASDRFQQLCEQPELLGQIAVALLRPHQAADEFLLDGTLARIAGDVASERSAAAWLTRARHDAQRPRAGYAGRKIGIEASEEVPVRELEREARLLRPEVRLRSDPVTKTWRAWLSLPNLSPLARVSREVHEALLKSRAWAPASDTPISRARLLYDSVEIRLDRWPTPAAPLFSFEGLAAGLEAALLRSWSGPQLPALFRIQADGHTALPVQSRSVLPDQRYVAVYSTAPDGAGGRPSAVPYPDVFGLRLDIPRVIDPALVRFLQKLQCEPIQSSSVWPAGSVPVRWDGDGAVEWLTTDRPMLGLQATYELAEVAFEVRGVGSGLLTSVPAGAIRYLKLPALEVGEHDLEVKERTTTGRTAVRRMVVRIREPRRLDVGDGPVRVWPEPHSKDLGDLWSGNVAVCAVGPAQSASVDFTLATRPAGTPLATARFSANLPLRAEAWATLLDDHVLQNDDLALAYDEARWARVRVDAGKFGKHELEFERSIPPLRWRLHESSDTCLVTLRDDTDRSSPLSVQLYSFDRPKSGSDLAAVPDVAIVVPRSGGLVVATRGASSATALVPPAQRTFRSLGDMAFRPEITGGVITTPTLAADFRVLEMWSRAPLPGHLLARIRRGVVVKGLHAHLSDVVTGPNWARAESDLRNGHRAKGLQEMNRILQDSAAVTKAEVRWILQFVPEIENYTPDRRIDLLKRLLDRGSICGGQAWAAIVKRHPKSTAEWAAEFYLRMASDPELASWAGTALDDGLALARGWPLPLRLARLMVATSAVESDAYPPLIPNWTWR